MSVRTTSTSVEAILAGHYDGKISLTGFISTATALTDWLESKDTDGELGATLLERVEAHLAAHFYAHADQIAQSKSTGGAGGTFQGQTAMVLMGTQYGQTACLLDVTGRLAQRSKEAETGMRSKVTVQWMGKPKSEQTDYEDRD